MRYERSVDGFKVKQKNALEKRPEGLFNIHDLIRFVNGISLPVQVVRVVRVVKQWFTNHTIAELHKYILDMDGDQIKNCDEGKEWRKLRKRRLSSYFTFMCYISSEFRLLYIYLLIH